MRAESWSIDGVPMSSLCFQFERLDSQLLPERRGELRSAGQGDGDLWRPRRRQSRTLQFGAWILGQDGGGAPGDGWSDSLDTSEQALLHLLQPADAHQVQLTRTWTDHLGTHSATALAECTAFDRRRVLRFQARYAIDLHLADPMFYGDPVSTVLAVGVPAPITVPGDANTTAITLACSGQLTNPKVTNASPAPQVWVKVGTAVAAGDSVTVDVPEPSVLRTSDGANLIGALTHSGARAWFGLAQGTNTVTLTADAGTGTATLRYRPAYY